MCNSCRDDTLWDAETHTVAKHQLLQRYLQAWFPTLASFHGRLLFVDGFAGPGRYATGEPGSPLVALHALLSHKQRDHIVASCRELAFHFVEQREDRVRHLKSELADISLPDGVRTFVHASTFEATLGPVLDELRERDRTLPPSFLFLDPFGPAGMPMSVVGRLAAHRAVEVLINFAYQPMNQWFVSDQSKHHRLDELFGGDAWRAALAVPAESREQVLVDAYLAALRNHGFSGVAFRMINRQNQTQYYLVFGTQHHLGMRYFKEAAWKVSQNGEFSYSDLRQKEQLSFGQSVTEEMVAVRLEGELYARYRNRTVPKRELEEFADWDPVALQRHLRGALLRLERSQPPKVTRVELPDGSRRQRWSFPRDSVVTFGNSKQGRLI